MSSTVLKTRRWGGVGGCWSRPFCWPSAVSSWSRLQHRQRMRFAVATEAEAMSVRIGSGVHVRRVCLPEAWAEVHARQVVGVGIPPCWLPLSPVASQGRKNSHLMRKVDVGGFRLGDQLPRVGYTDRRPRSGSRSSSGAWMLLQPRVAKTTRVCSYDRAGLGYSDPRPRPGRVPVARAVTELHTLLAGAGISPPYVLGGWSPAAFSPGSTRCVTRLKCSAWSTWTRSRPPLTDPLPPKKPSALPDSFEWEFGLEERSSSFDLGARPLVVLYSARAFNDPSNPQELIGWKRLARQSRSSILVRADHAGPHIQLEARA